MKSRPDRRREKASNSMRYDILTIFPDFFESIFSFGMIKKAQEKGIIKINAHDVRDFSTDKHRTVDDAPYGGGGGMLMKPEPIGAAIETIRGYDTKSLVILTTPAGEKFSDRIARELAEYEQLVVICGRYEGIDERVSQLYVDRQISIGDYVLTGGEYAASIIIDGVSRFIPGVLGNESSSENDSFKGGLLEYPQYTRPETYMGEKVPEVLISGNHKEIVEWRRAKSLEKTFRKRPDLIDRVKLGAEDLRLVKGLKKANSPYLKTYIALVHYPVYNKKLKIVTTAFTNLDLHDIARAGATYGIRKFYLAQPNPEQQELANRVLRHWSEEEAALFNKSRAEALGIVEIRSSVEEIIDDIERMENKRPKLIVTDARAKEGMSGYSELRDIMFSSGEQPYLILFGTGWGLSEEIMESADYSLKPVSGYTDYNHLSVRSAAAIILDRLFSCKI